MKKKDILNVLLISTTILGGLAYTTSIFAADTIGSSEVSQKSSNDSQSYFEKAMLTKKDNISFFDGNKLKFENEENKILFQDDFSSNDFSKWTSHNDDVSVTKQGNLSAATFLQGGQLTLNDVKGLIHQGYYRVSYDIKYENYVNTDDVPIINYQFANASRGIGALPIRQGENEWQHVSDVVSNENIDNSNIGGSSVTIKGPKISPNKDIKVYITNVTIETIEPTFIEDFSDGKIDPSLMTNENFEYNIIDENNEKVLKVTMPKNSISIDKKMPSNVLSSKSLLPPVSYDPNYGITAEGTSFIADVRPGSTDAQDGIWITGIAKSDHGDFAEIGHSNSSSYFENGQFAGMAPSSILLTSTSDPFNPTNVDFGLKVSTDNGNSLDRETILYIRNFKSYKGVIQENNVIDNVKRVIK